MAPKNEQRAKTSVFVWIPLEVGFMHPVVWLVSGRPIAAPPSSSQLSFADHHNPSNNLPTLPSLNTGEDDV